VLEGWLLWPATKVEALSEAAVHPSVCLAV